MIGHQIWGTVPWLYPMYPIFRQTLARCWAQVLFCCPSLSLWLISYCCFCSLYCMQSWFEAMFLQVWIEVKVEAPSHICLLRHTMGYDLDDFAVGKQGYWYITTTSLLTIGSRRLSQDLRTEQAECLVGHRQVCGAPDIRQSLRNRHPARALVRLWSQRLEVSVKIARVKVSNCPIPVLHVTRDVWW